MPLQQQPDTQARAGLCVLGQRSRVTLPALLSRWPGLALTPLRDFLPAWSREGQPLPTNLSFQAAICFELLEC